MFHYTQLLLRNGLSFFYGDVIDINEVFSDHEIMVFGLIAKLERCICIAYQLLALGFERRELHPSDLPVRDEHLEWTRINYADDDG